MLNRAPIMVDGAVVGYLSLSWSEEIPIGEGLPPSVGLGAMPASPGAARALGGAQRHHGRLGATHGTSSSHLEKHGPTFRPHLTPRGSAEPAKPEHFTVGDVQSAVKGGNQAKGTGGWWTAERVNHGIKKLMAAGYPEVSARAMIATAAGVEAGKGPADENSVGGGHRGIFQWSGSRQRAGGGLPTDYEGQLDFAIKELSGPEKLAGDALRNAKTPQEAANAMLMFERGGYGTGKILRTMNEMGESHQKPVGITRLGAGETPKAESTFANTSSNQSDLEYLRSRGAHATINMDENYPPGAAHGVEPEFAARMAAAGRAYEAETGQKARYSEMDRDYATQAVYYDRFKHGGPIAAPPGTSRHERTPGEAADVPRGPFHLWLDKHASEFGLHFPVRNRRGELIDYPHMQADPSYKGSFSKPARTSSGNNVLFLPGMYSRYQGKSPDEIKGHIKRYADSKGSGFEGIDISADKPATQLKAARERLLQGGIKEVVGFSGGGYVANRLEKEFPNVKFTKIGVPNIAGNQSFPGGHMDQPAGLADSVKK